MVSVFESLEEDLVNPWVPFRAMSTNATGSWSLNSGSSPRIVDWREDVP